MDMVKKTCVIWSLADFRLAIWGKIAHYATFCNLHSSQEHYEPSESRQRKTEPKEQEKSEAAKDTMKSANKKAGETWKTENGSSTIGRGSKFQQLPWNYFRLTNWFWLRGVCRPSVQLFHICSNPGMCHLTYHFLYHIRTGRTSNQSVREVQSKSWSHSDGFWVKMRYQNFLTEWNNVVMWLNVLNFCSLNPMTRHAVSHPVKKSTHHCCDWTSVSSLWCSSEHFILFDASYNRSLEHLCELRLPIALQYWNNCVATLV